MNRTIIFSKVRLIIFITFIIFPFFSFPMILIEIYNKKKYAFTFMAIFMALVAYTYPPFADLFRHYSDYTEYSDMRVIDFFDESRGDFIVQTTSFVFAKFGIPFEFVRAIIVFLSYKMAFSMFYDSVNHNPNITKTKLVYFLLFLMVFFTVPLTSLCGGLRNSFAIMLFVFGFYKLHFLEQRKIGLALVIISTCVHFSLIICVPLIFLYNKFKPRTLILAGLCFFMFNVFLLKPILEVIVGDSFIVERLFIYTGDGMKDNEESMSLMGKISMWLGPIGFSVILSYLLFCGSKARREFNMVLIIFAVSLMFFSFLNVFVRYISLAIICSSFTFIRVFDFRRVNRVYITILCCVQMLLFLAGLYGVREFLGRSYLKKIVYSSTPYIIAKPYTMSWCNDNLSADGNAIN